MILIIFQYNLNEFKLLKLLGHLLTAT